ncbi:MAG: LssY C-terminal domain-containing protein, partial [Solirubrobacteraceae bacterium]|nr:LssY C-terminal domain-containing protein [Solirubrobacteraceae bacterium]
GRQQAFAYEQEVAGNASQRHHVRFWPTPDDWYLPGGRRVDWLAAGTYDRKVGLSLFTLQVTHKIDADIDAERDHVVATVRAADDAAKVVLLGHLFVPFHTRNGGGDIVRTDGAFPILDLTAVAPTDTPKPVRTAPPTGRRLPPLMLVTAGLLSAAKALGTLIGLLLLATGISNRTALFPDTSTVQLIQIGAGAAALVALWLLTLTRRRWARTLLMGVCTLDAVGQLASLGGMSGDDVSRIVLLNAGLSLLVLITVSSDGARRWVSRTEPTEAGVGARD